MATSSNKRQITLEILGDAKSLTQSAQMAERELAKLESIKLATKKLGVDFDATEVQAKLAKLDALKQSKMVLALDVDLAKAEKELDRLGTASSEAFKQKWSSVGDSLASVGQKMSLGLTAPIVGAFGLATKAASEYEDQLNVVTATFGPLSGEIQDFADKATTSFGLSKREAIEVASSFGLVLDKTKLSKQEVADYSVKLAGLSGDLSSFFGKTTEEASAAIRSGLIGESEPLRAFGVILSDNAVKAKAYATGIAAAGAELTESQKIQARYALILEQTGKAQGDYAKTADSSVNATKTARKELENAAVTLGQNLTPLLATGAKGVAALAREFGDLPKGVQQGVVVVGGLVAALGPVLTVAGNVTKAFSGMRGALDGLKSADGGLTNVGKAVAGLSVAGTVVGGVIAVRKAIEELQDRADAKRVREWVDAFAGIGDKDVADVVAASLSQFDDLPSKVTASKVSLSDLAKELRTFSPNKEDFPLLTGLQLSTKEMQTLRKELPDAIGQMDKLKRTFSDMLSGPSGLERASRVLAELKAGGAPTVVTDSLRKQYDDYTKLLVAASKDADATRKKIEVLTDGVTDQTVELEKNTKTWEELRVEYAKIAKTYEDANKGVADAQEKLRKTREAGEASVREAEKDRADAVKDASDKYAAALAHQREVADDTAEAIADAEQKVTDAVKDGAADVKAAKDKWADDVIAANRKVLDAEENLRNVQAENAKDVADATADAAKADADAADRTKEALADVADARADAAARAKDALDNQARAMERANAKIADAEQDLARVIEDANQRVVDAHREADESVTDALRNQLEVTQDTAERIADAQEKVVEAERRIAEVAEESAARVKEAKESAAEAAESAAARIAATEKSGADTVKSADKSVASARKDRDKAIKDGAKDIADAEKAYQEAVRKSGLNSDAARSAAERLADARERAAERSADAEERLAEATERAADARKKAEQDVAKAKADAAKSAEDSVKKVEKAEKDAEKAKEDAAKAKEDAEKDLAKTRADAAQAQIEAAQKVADAQAEAQRKVADAEKQRTRDVDAAETNLAAARKERDQAQIDSDAAIAKAKEEADGRIGKAEESLRKAQAEQETQRQKGLADIATAAEEASKREVKAKQDVANAAVEKATAETKAAEDVRVAEKKAEDEKRQAELNLAGVVESSEKANQKAFDETRKVVETNLETIKKAADKVGEARKKAAEDAKGAEDDLTTALENQRLKYLEVDAAFSTQYLNFKPGIADMITQVKTLASEIGKIPSLPSVPSSGGSGGGGGGQSGGGGASGSGGGPPVPLGADTITAVDANGNVIIPDYVVGDAGNVPGTALSTLIQNPTPNSNVVVPNTPLTHLGSTAANQIATPQNPAGSISVSAGVGSQAGAGGTVAGPSGQVPTSPTQGPVAPTSGSITIAGKTLPKGSQYGASGDVDQPGGEMGLILRTIRLTETGNRNVYNALAKPWPGPASGVYQFIGSTWRGLRASVGGSQYEHAVLAPISVQHAAAAKMAADILRRHNNYVDSVPGGWFHEGIYNTPNRWNTLVDSIVGGSGNPGMTMAGYLRKWIKNYRQLGGTGQLSPAAQSLVGGGAGVGEDFMSSVAASGGIPTNAGGGASTGGGAVLAESNASLAGANGIVATSGPAGGAAGIVATTGTVAANGIVASSGTAGISISGGGGTSAAFTSPNGIVATSGSAASEAAIAAAREAGLRLEARVQARRVEMLRLEELAAKMRAEQLAIQNNVTDSAERQRLAAETTAATVAAAAATEARIAADRNAGAANESVAAGTRKNGAEVEAEILRIRGEAERLTGQGATSAAAATNSASAAAASNAVAAAVAAGAILVDAANSAGHSIATAGAAAANAVAHSAADAAAASASSVGGKTGGTYDASQVVAHGNQSFIPGTKDGPSPTVVMPDWTPSAVSLISSRQAEWLDWQRRRNQRLTGLGYPVQMLTLTPPDWWTGPNHPLEDPTGVVGAPTPTITPDTSSFSSGFSGSVVSDGSTVGQIRQNDSGVSGTVDLSGSGSGDLVTQIVQAPFVIALDGKELAEGLYEYQRQIARRNADRTADGGWRVNRR